MAYCITRQKYLEEGLCIQCGSERDSEGSTPRFCAACAAKKRASKRNHRARLKATGLCMACGKKRTGIAKTPTYCEVCARKNRVRGLAYVQRKRNEAAGYTPGDGRNVKKWNVGLASTARREGGIYNFTLHLDRPSLDALLVIRKRYKDAEYKAKREPLTHQLSRLVREIIWRYEPNRVVVKPRKHRLLLDDVANLSLDGRTRAILERQAARSFAGNKSAALRAMLIQSQGFRRAFTGRER